LTGSERPVAGPQTDKSVWKLFQSRAAAYSTRRWVNRDGAVKCNVFLAISWKPVRGQNSSIDAVVAILRTGLRVMKDKLVPLTDLPDEPIHLELLVGNAIGSMLHGPRVLKVGRSSHAQ
jgi:hypothetical protein